MFLPRAARDGSTCQVQVLRLERKACPKDTRDCQISRRLNRTKHEKDEQECATISLLYCRAVGWLGVQLHVFGSYEALPTSA